MTRREIDMANGTQKSGGRHNSAPPSCLEEGAPPIACQQEKRCNLAATLVLVQPMCFSGELAKGKNPVSMEAADWRSSVCNRLWRIFVQLASFPCSPELGLNGPTNGKIPAYLQLLSR